MILGKFHPDIFDIMLPQKIYLSSEIKNSKF